MMSVGMLEMIKGLLCVSKCGNKEQDIILFGDTSMHIMAHIATKVQHNNIQKVNIHCETSSINI